MPVFWLNSHEMAFPHPTLAEPGGLLAVGGDLSPERLVLAYRNGIFPWFEDGGSFFWYSPDPRFVLFPKELKVQKSMRAVFNQGKFDYSLDTCFERVIRACANTPRHGQDGSWISEAFIEGYTELHRQGVAHSVEVWAGSRLVGGLYGLALGRMFFGESMFALEPNASKAGFITFVRALDQAGFWLIDCQQETLHLHSLGARNIPREKFLDYLTKNTFERSLLGAWTLADGMIVAGAGQDIA
ncbi:MAG: leucyl/phenylalanyl-tRNA--protein transferase [Saprospirales bacterium]|nr:leucyl/phenylalanyl-tRNA--protein transferase [Saprospirales bacterium]MBK8923916.1 leucyl/phenylalanyl-tRNA--protein transferase [Saprospirales bacterium]